VVFRSSVGADATPVAERQNVTDPTHPARRAMTWMYPATIGSKSRQPPGPRPRSCQPFSPRLSPAGQSREHAAVHDPLRTASAPPSALFVERRTPCPLSRPTSRPARFWRQHDEAPADIVVGCARHGQQTGGNQRKEEIHTRGPDEGNPTPKRQGRGPGVPGPHQRRSPGGPARACLVEVIGVRRDPNSVKRRKASAPGRLAPSSESPIFVGGAGVLATGRRKVCCRLPGEICRVPHRR
jgi:hypothetical protein